MVNLHKQLKHIISFHGGPNTNVEQCVGDIEKAIQEAGYIQLPSHPPLMRMNADGGVDNAMTGLEWYARLEKGLYTDDVISLKRNILMDLIHAILNTPRKESSAELWKLHIDAALDQLDESVNKPAARRAAGMEG